MTTGELAKICGISPSTIYQYQRKGFLKSYRNSWGIRIWTEDDVERVLKVVKESRRAMLKGAAFNRYRASRTFLEDTKKVSKDTAGYIRLLEERNKLLEDKLHGRIPSRSPIEDTLEGICRKSPEKVNHKAVKAVRDFIFREALLWPTSQGGLTAEWVKVGTKGKYKLVVEFDCKGRLNVVEVTHTPLSLVGHYGKGSFRA